MFTSLLRLLLGSQKTKKSIEDNTFAQPEQAARDERLFTERRVQAVAVAADVAADVSAAVTVVAAVGVVALDIIYFTSFETFTICRRSLSLRRFQA